ECGASCVAAACAVGVFTVSAVFVVAALVRIVARVRRLLLPSRRACGRRHRLSRIDSFSIRAKKGLRCR
ncbi:MAG: hypothetical protein KH142_09305, partial [Slackia piriformis]|nr:hypothetical protein [Slackia piriformis]